MHGKLRYYSIYAWSYLCVNIVVILDGALVRAMNAGGGCGAHWPLCQGTLFPNVHILNTLIEFTHRIGSGLVGIGALILLVYAFLNYSKKHPVRAAACSVFCLVIFEALLGAGLVLFGLVENNTSISRIWIMGLHSANTFLLLGAITITATLSHVTYKKKYLSLKNSPVFLCLFLLFVTGVTGAMTALSDTIFKLEYVGQDLLKDIFQFNHVLKMLRGFHPIFALITSAVLGMVILRGSLSPRGSVTLPREQGPRGSLVLTAGSRLDPVVKPRGDKILSVFILFLICTQIFVGLFNLVFLTPLSLQIIHLFLADLLWITCILYFYLHVW